jgi:nucleoside-diphosphate-sugar epimerase
LKILLTGASGFLGSALARHLSSAGYQVALLLRPTSQLSRLTGLENDFWIGRCESDIDVDLFVKQVQPEVVIHTACSYGRRGETIVQIADANIRFGLLILQSLANTGRSFTFINTGTVLPPDVSTYALSKHQFIHWGRIAAAQSAGRWRFVNVLLQHMYGPGDDPSKFTTHVIHACLRNEPELKLTQGMQKRDFIYVDDVVSAYSTLLDHCEQLNDMLDVEVGSGVAPTIKEFVETVHRLTGSGTTLNFGALAYRTTEAMHCQADINDLSRFGWRPKYDLCTGLQKTIEKERAE